MRRAALAAALVLALSACGGSEEEFPVVEAPVADTEIGPEGAAGIASAIPLTVEAVTAAAPHFIVAAGEGQVEGDPYPLITLSLADEVVFTLLPTSDRARVNAITTRSTQARGPHGEVIENARFGDAIAAEVLFCRTRVMHEAFSFTCSDSESGRFWRSYQLPADYAGPVDPFASIDPDAATQAVLVEMTWFAPRDSGD